MFEQFNKRYSPVPVGVLSCETAGRMRGPIARPRNSVVNRIINETINFCMFDCHTGSISLISHTLR